MNALFFCRAVCKKFPFYDYILAVLVATASLHSDSFVAKKYLAFSYFLNLGVFSLYLSLMLLLNYFFIVLFANLKEFFFFLKIL